VAEQAPLERHEALKAHHSDQITQAVTSQNLGDLAIPAAMGALVSTYQVRTPRADRTLQVTVKN
jgi:hypothetical protein